MSMLYRAYEKYAESRSAKDAGRRLLVAAKRSITFVERAILEATKQIRLNTPSRARIIAESNKRLRMIGAQIENLKSHSPWPDLQESYIRRLIPVTDRLQREIRQRPFFSLLILSVFAGVMFGAVVAFQATMIEEAHGVRTLADYRPNLVTRVLAEDGETVVGEFSLERRIPITYDQIPDHLKKAIWAIEDDRFFQHIGIDPIRMVKAAINNIASGRKAEGASTLTQQLARAIFLGPEKTYTRKLKEILISLQIEHYYTKEQIMEMYCNQVFLGGGAYGFEAAAQYYFSKPLKDLTLEQSALLAGLPKAPSLYSPTNNEKAALERRNLVLWRMKEEDYISEQEYARAKETDIVLTLNLQARDNNSTYGYFVEEIRKEAERSFGTERTHTAGLSIYTTLDAGAQREAARALRRGLHSYQDRHGKRWRGGLVNVLESGATDDLAYYSHPDWLGGYTPGEYIYGLIMKVNPAGADVRFGDYSATITASSARWSGRSPSKLLKRGDLAVFKVIDVDEENKKLTVMLDQLPEVDGALVCLDSRTGDIKAMVGGYDFSTRKFNNVTQAERQTGSVFKPFIYAAALEAGFTAETVVSAETFIDPVSGWSPTNYDGSEGSGRMPLGEALQQSNNVVAVRLLSLVGMANAANIVERFGLPNPMKPVWSSALGATEEPLLDMTSAYSAFSNQGVRMKPYLIRRVIDADGNTLYEHQPEAKKAISPYVASQMQRMMRDVVTGGTAGSIMGSRELSRRTICGKTGTVNDFTDAWFIGYTPSYTTGVWVGFSAGKQSLGENEAGSVTALPIWIRFMEKYLKDKPNDRFPAAAPDKEIIARRHQAARIIRKAESVERKAQSRARRSLWGSSAETEN